MKRLLFATLLLIATSCTSEALLMPRAERLAAKEVKQMLYVPDSYEAIETSIDSAFLSKYTDPQILSAAAEIIEIEENGGIISIFKSADKISERAKFIAERADSLNEGEFIGWRVHHRYRANSRIGTPDIAEVLIFTDNIIGESKATFSLNAEDRYSYQRVVSLIERVTEAEEIRQNIGSAVETLIEEFQSIDYEEVVGNWEQEIESWSAETESQVESFVEEFEAELEAESATFVEEIEQISSEVKEQVTSVGKRISTAIEEESYFDDFGESSSNNISLDSDTMIELNSL